MEIVTKIAPIILALIMLGLGLGLKLEDFGRVFKTPKDFIVGFISQLIILPIVAYILILILRTPPEIAIGVMIIAAAPGGVTSNVMTKFADGDVALSISLTAVISLLKHYNCSFNNLYVCRFAWNNRSFSKYFNDRNSFKNVFSCDCACYFRDDYKKIC